MKNILVMEKIYLKNGHLLKEKEFLKKSPMRIGLALLIYHQGKLKISH